MSYNLTEPQKDLVRWMVQENRCGRLPDEFAIAWMMGGGVAMEYQGTEQPEWSRTTLDVLDREGLVYSSISNETKTSRSGGTSKRPNFKESTRERSRRLSLTAKAYQAVDSDFAAADTSFVKQLTPLADLTNLDDELKERSVLTLQVGGTNPKMWDMAVRTAVVVLEERLRDVGQIEDESRYGQNLVNDVFSGKGTLAGRLSGDWERQAYRDLFAGVVGVFRNRYAHRLVDPTPEDGGAFIVFVNLLLKMLEELRETT